MPRRKTCLAALAALAFGSNVSCGSGGSARSAGGFVPIDPKRPGDTLFGDAVTRFDAGIAAQTAGFAKRRAGDTAGATASFQAAQTELAAARGLFDQLLADAALCGPAPASIRCDAAACYGGRSSYELGIGANELAALTGAASTALSSFQDAATRLDAMELGYPASWMLDQAAYYDGRARYHLAQKGLDTWANARAQFQGSLAANAAGRYADNAQYYLGRCWYEEGLALVNVPVPPAPGSPGWLAASADFQSAETELRKVLSSYPASPYVLNARYYLGKTFYERPYDATVSLAGRVSDLNAAIGWFDQVIAANGAFLADARYWRGRCHYALAFDLVAAPNPPDVAQLDAALLDVKAVQPPSAYADNALYYAAKSYVNLHVATPTDATGAFCTAARPGDAAPASACDAYTALKTLSTTNASYAGSPYLAKTQSYIQTTLPSCICTW